MEHLTLLVRRDHGPLSPHALTAYSVLPLRAGVATFGDQFVRKYKYKYN